MNYRTKNGNLPENIIIRLFNDADLESVLELSQKAFMPVYESFRKVLGDAIYQLVYPNWIFSQGQYIKLICNGEDKKNIFVVEEKSKIIGYISFFMNIVKKSGEIGINAVHPNHQKRGIGKMMYEHVLGVMKSNGIKLVEVSTGGDPAHLAARCAYEKCDFIPLPLVKYYKAL
ncbi:MAG TPA: GNAT family N-acetyltransferase [Gammaproteobacteria bacterium]|jgi:GNAT superfamily N-acetyltransferase|nr:GNAT family N-acetyltransferase [Gammaproteobacteria bacterium]